MVENPDIAQAFQMLEGGLLGKINAKQKRLAKLRRQLESLIQEESDCVQEIAQMENAIAVFQSALGLGSDATRRNGVDAHRYLSQTVGQSAYDIMQMNNGRARVVEILKILLEAGKVKKYNSGYSTIKKTLDRDRRFEKVGKGEYTIVST